MKEQLLTKAMELLNQALEAGGKEAAILTTEWLRYTLISESINLILALIAVLIICLATRFVFKAIANSDESDASFMAPLFGIPAILICLGIAIGSAKTIVKLNLAPHLSVIEATRNLIKGEHK